MTLDEFSRELAKLLSEFLRGIDTDTIPVRLTFQLLEGNVDRSAPLRVDLSIRRVWVN